MALSRAEIGQWVQTEEASLVHRTLTAIYQYQHTSTKPLEELYGEEVVANLPTFGFATREELMVRVRSGRHWIVSEVDQEKLKPLEDLMPIAGIRNSAYWVQGERLFFSRQGVYLLPKGVDLDEQMRVAGVLEDGDQRYSLGITFTVKSNGLRVFDYLPLAYDNQMTINRNVEMARALEFRNHTLLIHLRTPPIYKQVLA